MKFRGDILINLSCAPFKGVYHALDNFRKNRLKNVLKSLGFQLKIHIKINFGQFIIDGIEYPMVVKVPERALNILDIDAIIGGQMDIELIRVGNKLVTNV